MNSRSIAKSITGFISENSSEILTVMAVSGVITTAVSATVVTYQSHDKIEDMKAYYREEGSVPPVKEYITLLWKDYLGTVIIGTATVACMIGSTTIAHKRNLALAGLYTMSEKTLARYQEKVVEEIGEKKAEKVRDKVAEQSIIDNPPTEDIILSTGNGDHLFYDALSGRYFKSDMEYVRRAQNDFNQDLIQDMYCDLNDLYSVLGLPSIDAGGMIGWNVDRLLEFEFTTTIAPNGVPCIVIGHVNRPTPRFRNY